jgi:hypothetical protein
MDGGRVNPINFNPSMHVVGLRAQALVFVLWSAKMLAKREEIEGSLSADVGGREANSRRKKRSGNEEQSAWIRSSSSSSSSSSKVQAATNLDTTSSISDGDKVDPILLRQHSQASRVREFGLMENDGDWSSMRQCSVKYFKPFSALPLDARALIKTASAVALSLEEEVDDGWCRWFASTNVFQTCLNFDGPARPIVERERRAATVAADDDDDEVDDDDAR